MPEPKVFADAITADHKVLLDEQHAGRHGHARGQVDAHLVRLRVRVRVRGRVRGGVRVRV